MLVFDMLGVQGASVALSATATSAALPASIIIDATGRKARAVHIYVVTNDLLVAFGGATPVAAGFGIPVEAGKAIRVSGQNNVEGVRIVNKVALSICAMIVTPEF
jgi:hypothetical protein